MSISISIVISCCSRYLQAAKELVEFVGGVEVGFEISGGKALAKVVEAACEKIERRGKHFLIGEHNVAPGGIRTSRKPQRITQARTSQRNGQAVFVKAVVEKPGESDGGKLRKMRSKADRIIMLRSAEPERSRADFLEDFHESGDTRIFLSRGCADERVSAAAKEVGVSVRDAGEFLPRHGMPAKEERPFVLREKFLRGLRDAHLRAAGLGDERVPRSVARNLGKKINRRGNGQSDVDEVSTLQRSGKFPVERRING